MRTNEQRIELMHQRAAQINRENRDRKIRLIQAASLCGGFVLVIVLAFVIRSLAKLSVEGNIPYGMSASVFARNEILGYVIIAIVAFLLGISVTVFCFYLRKWNEERS